MNFNCMSIVKWTEAQLKYTHDVSLKDASAQELHEALGNAVMMAIADNWNASKKARENQRKAFYISAEYLIGRLVYSNMFNLGILDEMKALFAERGVDLAILEDIEDDALGNGGLGRLAACFLDSAASCDLPLSGYGLRYKFGLFKQRFDSQGNQVENADDWTKFGDPWSYRRLKHAVKVQFPEHTVIAVPYDVPVIGYGGVAEGIAKMSMGNKIGFTFSGKLTPQQLFMPCYGAFIVELDGEAAEDELLIGQTIEEYKIYALDYSVPMESLQRTWEEKLESVFPCRIKTTDETPEVYSFDAVTRPAPVIHYAKPRVLIPVFPGTNCEYDTARAFEKAGAVPEILIIRNLSAADIEASVKAAAEKIAQSQIIMIPGGFSGGDEPEGSGKFITAFFRNPEVKDAVHALLQNRDGLMLGICNGFQALIKLGLVPFGEIVEMTDASPTLTFNTIARHQSMMVNTRIASNKSPWLADSKVGDIHSIAISHGEGRFVAPESLIQRMAANGQIATQYVDLTGKPTMDIRYNPNTSICAIEGITSPDGRVLGKMGHSERKGTNICKNIPGEKDQHIFENGVKYFL